MEFLDRSRRWSLWTFLVLPAFYFLTRDFYFIQRFSETLTGWSAPTFLDHWLWTPAALALAAASAVALGGWLIERVLRSEPLQENEALLFALPLGFGVMSLAVLGAGLLGWLNATVLWAILLVPIMIFHARVRLLWGAVQRGWRTLSQDWTLLESLCLNLLAWVLIHGCVRALAPPTDGDSLAYHLANAQTYLREGRVFFQRGNLWGAFPGHMEMLYVLALAVKGDALAQLLSWLMGAWLIASVGLFGTRFFKSRTIGLLGAAAFAVQPLFTTFFGTAMQDAAASLPVFLSLYALAMAVESGGGRWTALGGALAGLAAGTKYSALPFAALSGLAWAGALPAHKGGRLKELAIFAVAAAAIAGPWYARNAVWTGNPFWPTLSSVFGGKDLNPERTRYLSLLEEQPGRERSVKGWILLPWRMVTQFRFAHYYNPEYLTWPLLLIAAGLLWAGSPVPWLVPLFMVFALLGTIPIFSTVSFWRYFMPALPGLCLVMSWGAVALGSRMRFAPYLLMGVLMVAGLRLQQNNELYPALGLPTPGATDRDWREGYLEHSLPYYSVYRKARSVLPKNARVLLFEQSDAYYLNRPFQQAEPLYQARIPYESLSSPEALLDHLRGIGVTHVVFNEKGVMISNPWDRERLPAWYWRGQEQLKTILRGRSRILIRENGLGVYELPIGEAA